MKTCVVLAMMIFMTSCAGNECGWAKKIVLDEADVITRPTAEQIVAHNRKVERFCR